MGNPWGHWKTAHIYKNKLKWSYCSQDEKTPIPCQQSLPMLNTYFGDSGVKGSDKLVDLAGNKKKKIQLNHGYFAAMFYLTHLFT